MHYQRFILNINPIVDEKQALLLWTIHGVNVETCAANDDLRQEANLKARFLAEMSHGKRAAFGHARAEIRTPLACVIGTSSLLRYTPLNLEQEELLNTIRVCSQQLFTLINNVLDLSKLDQNRLSLENRPVQVERCINETIDIFTNELHRRSLDAVVEMEPSVPQWIISDELRLRQVLTNMLSNAVKFSKLRGLVKVSVSRASNSPGLLLFCIEDEGIGIPTEINPQKLFDTFMQLDSSIARKYGGSGLGLVISKKLVNLLGGQIWYESVCNQVRTVKCVDSFQGHKVFLYCQAAGSS